MKKQNTQKGIALITLTIIIIVLLILGIGVINIVQNYKTINDEKNVVENGGTIDYTKNETHNYQKDEEHSDKFIVSFDSVGGTSIENQMVEKGAKAQKPTEPTKEGCTFKGWMLNEVEYDFDTVVTSNLKLKAKWEEAKQDKDNEKETITVKAPTLTNKQGTKGLNQLSIRTKGAYAKSTKSISGYELYEKNGNKYSKVHSSTKDFGTKVTLDLGESKTYVARVYTYDKDKKKVYSAYSNELKVENKLKKPNLKLDICDYTEKMYVCDFIINNYDISSAEFKGARFELYEKSGTKVGEVEVGGAVMVELEPGTKKTFVAKTYVLNSKGQKVYSDYSNEITIDKTRTKTPTLKLDVCDYSDRKYICDFVTNNNISSVWSDEAGFELYEKSGTKVGEVSLGGAVAVELEPGTQKTFVAKGYVLNSKGQKVYSDYSNEITIDKTKTQTPTLKLDVCSYVDEMYLCDFMVNNDISSTWSDEAGFELYEKSGTKIGEVSIGGAVMAEVEPGTKKTFVAKAYVLNSKGQKVYSDYSNEITIDKTNN